MRRKCGAAALVFGVGIALSCICLPTASAQNRGPWNMEGVLDQLDIAAKTFRGLSADVERTKVTVVVNDRSTSTGSILVHGEKMLLEIKAPDPRTILRVGESLYIYTPGLKRVEEYNLGKNRALLDQFLLLGFGTEGKELRKGYLITLMGEEKLDDRKAIRLELTPKADAVRNQISKIEIWLDEASWLAVQQQFYEAGSGDYSIVRYTKMVRNAPIPEASFKPHWPKGTQRMKPQG